MILVTDKPVAAGTLVRCPKCGTSFGVPAVATTDAAPPETSIPQAASAKPAIAVAVPVMTARPVADPAPPVPLVQPATMPDPDVWRQPRRAPESFVPDETWDTGLSTKTHRETNGQESASHKRGKRNKNDPVVKWLLIGSGVALLVAAGIVIAVLANTDDRKKPQSKTPAKEVPANNKSADRLEKNTPSVSPAAEKKDKSPARTGEKPGKAAASSGNMKKKSNSPMDDDSEMPKPIPGLKPPEKEKPDDPTPKS
jgi:hypothetical protein